MCGSVVCGNLGTKALHVGVQPFPGVKQRRGAMFSGAGGSGGGGGFFGYLPRTCTHLSILDSTFDRPQGVILFLRGPDPGR